MGKNALKQHADKDIHRYNRSRVQPGLTTKLKQQTLSGFSAPVFDLEKQSRIAEAYWGLFTAEHSLPFLLSDHASEIFGKMFPDSKIAAKFSSQRTKTNYIVSDGIAVNFHNELVAKLKHKIFSLMIDESNKQYGKKFLHVLVKYFDKEQGDIVQDFLDSVVVNKANSDNLVAAILKLLRDDDLPLDNMIQIMSDSPSVMRGAVNGVVTVIKRTHAPHLIIFTSVDALYRQ